MNENKQIAKIKESIIQNKWVVGLVLGVLVVFVVLSLLNKKPENTVSIVEGCRPGDLFSQTSGKSCSEEPFEACKEGDLYDRNTGKPCAGVEEKTSTSPATSYETALKTYAKTSILFNAECVGTPEKLEVLKGGKVLIANNSNKTLELSILNREASLQPYHYMTSSVYTAGEVNVTCNGKPSATVVVK